MAEDIVEAQSATLQAQEDILRNGQELKHTLVQSTEGTYRQTIYTRHNTVLQSSQGTLGNVFNVVQ